VHRLLLLLLLALVPAYAQDSAPAPPKVAEADLVDGERGLRQLDLAQGEGPQAARGDTVALRLSLWSAAGEPVLVMAEDTPPIAATIGAGALLSGLEIGLVGVRAGGKRYLRIPSELAYGDAPPPGAPAGLLLAVVEIVGLEQSAASRPASGSAARRAPEKPPEVDAWTTLPSGVMIADLVVGDGPPIAYDRPIFVDYTGWVADTLVRFDSSLERGEPFRVMLGSRASERAIHGWEIALRTMRVGGRRLVRIPAYLAYGDQDRGELIPPHSELLFEIHILRMD